MIIIMIIMMECFDSAPPIKQGNSPRLLQSSGKQSCQRVKPTCMLQSELEEMQRGNAGPDIAAVRKGIEIMRRVHEGCTRYCSGGEGYSRGTKGSAMMDRSTARVHGVHQ